MNPPRVSAICITDNRPAFLSNAIYCFLAQDYSNKELIVAYPEDDRLTAALIAQLSHPDIVAFPIGESCSLGEKRNLAIQTSSGDYFCCWDDDDWYHPSRLSEQVQHATTSGKAACSLGYVILRNMLVNESFLSFKRPWEQTILCDRQQFTNGVHYGDLDRGEDSILVSSLLQRDNIVMHLNPLLYIYNFHGGNACQQSHWNNNIFRHGTKFSLDANDLVLALMSGIDSDIVSRRLHRIVDALIR